MGSPYFVVVWADFGASGAKKKPTPVSARVGRFFAAKGILGISSLQHAVFTTVSGGRLHRTDNSVTLTILR